MGIKNVFGAVENRRNLHCRQMILDNPRLPVGTNQHCDVSCSSPAGGRIAVICNQTGNLARNGAGNTLHRFCLIDRFFGVRIARIVFRDQIPQRQRRGSLDILSLIRGNLCRTCPPFL